MGLIDKSGGKSKTENAAAIWNATFYLFIFQFFQFFIYSLYQSYNEIEGTTVQQIKARKVTITIFIC